MRISDYDLQNSYDFVITNLSFMVSRSADSEWKIDKVSHPNHHILAYALDGEASYSFSGKIHHVKKGDILFFPKNFIHSAHSNPDNPWNFYSVAFDVQFLNPDSLKHFMSMDNILNCSNIYKLPYLFSDLYDTWTGKRIGYMLKFRSILTEILYLIFREGNMSTHNTLHYQKIDLILSLIDTKYTNTYTIEELAKISGLSTSHFRLIFKKITGVTVVQYQNNIKVNKAKDLLLSGDCNVTEAALSVGFNDIYYFSRLFKKITGVNPSEYLMH